MAIKKVGVVGCGLMGHGITQIAAQAGYDVTVREVNQERLDSGLGPIRTAAHGARAANSLSKGRKALDRSPATTVTR